MRILYVDLEREWRGGQSQALLTVRGLLGRGHDVTLVAVGKGELSRRAAAAQVPVTTVPSHSRRWHVSKILRGILAESRADIVHTNEPHALTAAWLAKAHRHSKLIFSRRVAYRIGTGWISRQRYLSAAKIFAISKFVAESVLASGIPKDHVKLVYEGVAVPPPIDGASHDAARAKVHLPKDDFLFASIGYLLAEKGHEHLVRAFAEIARAQERCTLLLAGDGPERRRLELLAAGLGVRDRVIFTGLVEDVSEVYKACDAFVFPSLTEPLGTSMLNAMAYGLPVVGVARGGVPEYVEPGVSGLLVNESSAEALAPAMNRIYADAELRRRLGEHAREQISDNFSADRMVENTVRGYEEVINSDE